MCIFSNVLDTLILVSFDEGVISVVPLLFFEKKCFQIMFFLIPELAPTP
jgi:hypothetical protein